ncbi:MAG: sugar transferase [Phycisphaerales bacterium]|nr:sugar transferase [Phycisphaerales bacterium]
MAGAEASQTVWGLDIAALHGRFWASRGVQVVWRGTATELAPDAELYLLLEPGMLTIFRPAAVLDLIAWMDPDLTMIRLVDVHDPGYHEKVESGPDGRFLRFRREYRARQARSARCALTTDREIATTWQVTTDSAEAWRRLRRLVPRDRRYAASLRARVYYMDAPGDPLRFVRHLVRVWTRPDSTVLRAHRLAPKVWADEDATVSASARLVGPLWIGAGRSAEDGISAVGPAVMWDVPDARPAADAIPWLELEPLPLPDAPPRPAPRRGRLGRVFKRGFDIAFSLGALAVTLPFYPIVAAAIVAEDGFPVFFRHGRETLGGREFGCIKFRSMRRDAERIKQQLAARNEADGPQFFMKEDPRLTRVGRFLRKYQIDEWPQFINVLRGDMSVVGPRPSPYKENQFCPPWREARLSVRPGVTGLWQTSRTRQAGADFQEWIRFDIEYVEKQSFWLDLRILVRTLTVVFREVAR